MSNGRTAVPFSATPRAAVMALSLHRGDQEVAAVKCVMILDDEADVVETLTALLTPTYKVIGQTNPRLALDTIHHGGVDVLVTDVVMPGMDGFRVALEAKQRHPDLPVVILSGYVDAKNKEEAHMLGRYGDAVLSKPIHIQELILVIRRLLGQQDPRGKPAAPASGPGFSGSPGSTRAS